MGNGTTAIRSPTPDIANHQVVLTQLKETTEVAQRLRGDPLNSFVRLDELIAAGIVNYIGGVLSANKITNGNASTTVHVADSITGAASIASPLVLVNDTASPGPDKIYGTNGSGVRGWQAVAGGGTVTSAGVTSMTLFVTGSPITTNGTIDVEFNVLTTKGDLVGYSTVLTRVPVGTDGSVLTADSTQATGVKWAAGAQKVGAQWVQVPYGTAITTATNPVLGEATAAGTIQEVRIYTQGGTGSCSIKVWKAPAGTVPTVANDITGGTPPSINSGTSYVNTTLTGWTISVSQGDVFLFTVASTSVFTMVNIFIRIG